MDTIQVGQALFPAPQQANRLGFITRLDAFQIPEFFNTELKTPALQTPDPSLALDPKFADTVHNVHAHALQ